jgi:hypothetical protein
VKRSKSDVLDIKITETPWLLDLGRQFARAHIGGKRFWIRKNDAATLDGWRAIEGTV